MQVYSMTGYASAQNSKATTTPEQETKGQPAVQLGMEVRAVNSRFLDLNFKLADELRTFEPALRELLTRRLKRGKVEVRAAVESTNSSWVITLIAFNKAI